MTQFTSKQVVEGALEPYRYQPYDFTVADDRGNVFHVNCAIEDAKEYGDNDPDKDCDAARIFEPFNHWEGEDLYCDCCSQPIEAIYGNPFTEEEN